MSGKEFAKKGELRIESFYRGFGVWSAGVYTPRYVNGGEYGNYYIWRDEYTRMARWFTRYGFSREQAIARAQASVQRRDDRSERKDRRREERNRRAKERHTKAVQSAKRKTLILAANPNQSHEEK